MSPLSAVSPVEGKTEPPDFVQKPQLSLDHDGRDNVVNLEREQGTSAEKDFCSVWENIRWKRLRFNFYRA